jgi:hypothetical protein
MTGEIRTTCKVGADGRVVIPVGVAEAGTEVDVTISPHAPHKRAGDMTREEYAAFIDSVTGKWIGEFPEIRDLPPQDRDPL